jgi:hypothetical protein
MLCLSRAHSDPKVGHPQHLINQQSVFQHSQCISFVTKPLYNSRTSLVSVKQEGSQAMEEAETTPRDLDLPHFILDQVIELTGAERAALLLLDDQG